MKKFNAKTVEEAVELASKEFNLPFDQLNYQITLEEKKLFSKKAEIVVYELSDVISFAEQYITTIMTDLKLDVTVKTELEDSVLKMTLNTSHNSVLIGKNGQTLQAINMMVRQAVGHKFKKHYRLLVDINQYKNDKYEKLIKMAIRLAKDVSRSKVKAVLEPMSSDERRVIHNALSKFNHVKTESIGQGHKRQIIITYVD
jgi:spoIIIJ-associated protein